MGMSGRTYNARRNEITKTFYNHLLATGKRNHVHTRNQQNGETIYFLNY